MNNFDAIKTVLNENLVNLNGCSAKATSFLPHRYTNYSMIQVGLDPVSLVTRIIEPNPRSCTGSGTRWRCTASPTTTRSTGTRARRRRGRRAYIGSNRILPTL
jgi:hypothetical protein